MNRKTEINTPSMGRIDTLINELCPEGVEFVRLGKVCDFITGFAFKASLFKSDGEPICKTTNIQKDAIDFSQMECFHLEDYDTCLDKYIIMPQDIVIGMSGTIKIGINNSSNKCYLNQRVGKFAPHIEYLNNKFLYYILLNSLDIFCEGIVGGSVKNLSNNDLKNLEIPLPPLPIQEEIVRILDTFTELQAELQAELQTRQLQYQYYRDQLLSFDGREDIKWKKLGEVFDTTTDFTAAGSFADIAKNVVYNRDKGYALLVRTTDIKSNFSKEDKVYITQSAFEYLWRVNLNRPSIILPNIGANCGEVHFITPETLPQEHCALGPNALLLRTSTCNNRFYYHYFNTNTFQKKLRKIISPGGQTKFNKTELRKIDIPLPSLEEQQRIVSILDRFDTLVNDLSQGLPAEIEARRQQYEYYRDKLLTFKRKKA